MTSTAPDAATTTPFVPKRHKATTARDRLPFNDTVSNWLDTRFVLSAALLLSIIGNLFALTKLAEQGHKPRYIPYAVEVDRHGDAVALSPAIQLDSVDPATIKRATNAAIRTFIEQARIVTPDVNMQNRAINMARAYVRESDPAFLKMRDWYGWTGMVGETPKPFVRAAHETVAIKFISVLQESEETWQVEWMEHAYALPRGDAKRPLRMRALVRVYRIPVLPDAPDTQNDNPLGLYVRDFDWSEQAAGAP